MKHLALLASLALVHTALSAVPTPAAAKPTPDPAKTFAVACSNAWLKGFTTVDPTAVALGSNITFTVALCSVTNAIPEGRFAYRYTRTGDDGQKDTGTKPATKAPFTYTTKSDQPGGVQLFVEFIDKQTGKPVERGVGKTKTPLTFAAGALVAPEKLVPSPLTKDDDKILKPITKRLGRPKLAKIAREPVELKDLKGVKLYRVTLPSVTAHPVKGLLALPDVTTNGTRLACRLTFSATGYEKDIPLPQAARVKASEIQLTVAYAPGKPEERTPEFCADLYVQTLLALAYAKSLPEWNGNALIADGWGSNALLAIFAAAANEGVTELVCGNLISQDLGPFTPTRLATRLPPSCRLTVPHAGLGDRTYAATNIVQLWNAAPGDKSVVWIQGAQGWSIPANHKGRDTRWEKLAPVRFVRMDAEHAKTDPGFGKPYPDLDLALRDTIVIEYLIDPTKPETLDTESLSQLLSYATKDLTPLVIYASIPDKKIKDKDWTNFLEYLKKKEIKFPFPTYVNAGMDLPRPDTLPWIRVADPAGVLRYSGNNVGLASNHYRQLAARIPKADPVFAFAQTNLLAKTVELLAKKKRGEMLYKAIEVEYKKSLNKDPARATEAEHLLIGMKQAVVRRLKVVSKLASERPGLGLCEYQNLVAEWPTVESKGGAALKNRLLANPDTERLAKFEKEKDQLLDWKPTKSSDIKKRDIQLAAFRKKLEKLTKSKNSATQGEALLIQTELDTPPADPAQ